MKETEKYTIVVSFEVEVLKKEDGMCDDNYAGKLYAERIANQFAN